MIFFRTTKSHWTLIKNALPCGEYTLKLMGKFEMPLLLPVILSVSSSISFLMARKSMNFCPLQWRNSPYSVGPLISCKIRGRRVTMPEPRGRKSLRNGNKVRVECLEIALLLQFFTNQPILRNVYTWLNYKINKEKQPFLAWKKSHRLAFSN